MNSYLLFLLKSTLILSLLYLCFRLFIRKEPFFNQSRIVMVCIVLASIIIPFINLPHPIHSIVPVEIDPIFQSNTMSEAPVLTNDSSEAIHSSMPVSDSRQSLVITAEMILLYIFLAGFFISLFRLVYSIISVLLLFRKSRRADLHGTPLMITNEDIPAFSFRKYILISQHDYDTNAEAILTHELSHIRQGHFYDLMLMELLKIMYWFNPLVYFMNRDMKEIHEFQADEHTLNSGIDASKYQLLIIEKGVGQQKFALANSFNHCQIKNRITMMNKSKNSKVWNWKVATFLPLLVFSLMAFGKKGENFPEKSTLPEKTITSSKIIQKEHEQFSQKIEIKGDGNYIDNKLCSLEEIAMQDQEWRNASNDWIFLLIHESIPLKRIDEVRGVLKGNFWVVQSTVNSEKLVYYSGDVSKKAKFTQSKWDDWFDDKLNTLTEGRHEDMDYSISISMIIDENGKVRDGHVTKGCDYPEINEAYNKILSQVPDWEPAMRGNIRVSVYYTGMIANSQSKKK